MGIIPRVNEHLLERIRRINPQPSNAIRMLHRRLHRHRPRADNAHQHLQLRDPLGTLHTSIPIAPKELGSSHLVHGFITRLDGVVRAGDECRQEGAVVQSGEDLFLECGGAAWGGEERGDVGECDGVVDEGEELGGLGKVGA